MPTKAELADEADVLEIMIHAAELAVEYFGKAEPYAVEEIYDYLQLADEEEFIADLKRVMGYAKIVYKVDAPTPEQVFGLFDRIFNSDDE